MGGVHTRADKAMAQVVAGAEGGLHVAAIMGIHVHSVIRAAALGRLDKPLHHRIAVGPAAVLGTDGYLITTDTFTGDAEQFWAVQYLEKDRYRIIAENGQMVQLKENVFSTDEEEYVCFVFRTVE